MEEEALAGGFVTAVMRVGDTVRRAPPPDPRFTRELLGLFEQRSWAGAPRFLGVDERGREILSYLDGHVAWEPDQPASVTSPGSLARLAGLVRQFHDLTAGTLLAGDQEAVCHNDLSPRNTVYRDRGDGLVPVAFIDWDIAAPGARIHDLAHVCWQYLDLGPAITDVPAASASLRLICDAYGLERRDELIDTIWWWQDRCWRGIEARAAAGDPAMARLRDTGAARSVREAAGWTEANQSGLAASLA